MDATLTLDEIDRHVSGIFDINVAATHCIRLVCQDCARLSILPVPGPGRTAASSAVALLSDRSRP